MWYPEADEGATLTVQAFAEEGHAPTVPGPLVRVPEGTVIQIALKNTLDSAIIVYGLHRHPGTLRDSVIVPAGGTRELQFNAGSPGTYYYWATSTHSALEDRTGIDSQLSGALVVDPRSPADAPHDRVFVLGVWNRPADTVGGVHAAKEILVINGKSWPHTEQFTFAQGDSVSWRWVNPTSATHPMHLHVFYFTVRSRGSWGADTIYRRGEGRLANTELMRVGGTMSIRWVAERPGNWVFHCHFAFHVSDERVVVAAQDSMAGGQNAMDQHGHRPHAMAGLVLGLHVLPRATVEQKTLPVERRNLRLLLQSAPRRFGDKPAYGFVLQGGVKEPKPDSVDMPGPTLFLRRGEPVRITVVNHLKEPGAVHWHGIELESFPDGVPNWSGMPGRLMRPIAPGDSFVAEFTPPRAGTFIYHSHMNERIQINSGMYGALIVTDPDHPFDEKKEKIILVGGAGPPNADDDSQFGFVNGGASPAPIEMETGLTYRLRLINIHPDWRVEFTLGSDTSLMKWRQVANDGADLPAAQRRLSAAYLLTGPGQTADFEFTPQRPGTLRLLVKTRAPGWIVPVDVHVSPTHLRHGDQR